MKNLTNILVPIVVILVGLAAAGGLYYFTKERVPGTISLEEASEKAVNYINNNFMQGGVTASLIEASKESGVYSLKLKVENEEYITYVTKDGKILFLQGIEMPEKVFSKESGIPKQDVPYAQLFVMSFCSFGNQAEEIMMNVVDLLGDKAEIELHYVIYSNYMGGGSEVCLDEESQYCSMHGIQELNQGIRELCVQKYQKEKFWDFVRNINTACNYQDVDSCWEAVAQGVGIDVEKIKKCEKEEGLAFAENELQLNKKYGITGSPQLIINDMEYTGSRTAEAYKTAICDGFNNPPEECSQTLTGGANASQGGCE